MGFNTDFLYRDLTVYDSRLLRESLNSDIALARASIGQHEDLATPLHMAMIAAAVANGGTVPELDLVDAGGRVLDLSTGSLKLMEPQTAQTLKGLMRGVIEYGTGTKADLEDVTVYGKTGSAQVGGDQAAHAWFMGFAEEVPLAICVMVEHGNSGGGTAAPIAGRLLEKAVQYGVDGGD